MFLCLILFTPLCSTLWTCQKAKRREEKEKGKKGPEETKAQTEKEEKKEERNRDEGGEEKKVEEKISTFLPILTLPNSRSL